MGEQPPRRFIDFAARRWWVKRATEPVGPGRNRFDDSTDAVQVNADGSLSLRVRRVGGRWLCAEVVGEQSTGYGTYEWTVSSDVRRLERHVVCGMFSWSEDPADHNRELDIEVSAWGTTGGVVGQFVVQPSEDRCHRKRFTIPSTASWTCSFEWSPTGVAFRAARASWMFDRAGVPPPGEVHPRINLWLHDGAEPLGSDPVEVRIGNFRYTPRGYARRA